VDEGSEVFVGGDAHPLVVVLEEGGHDLSEACFALLLAAQLAHFQDNAHTHLADGPVAVVL
jgi:hypothetical protein